MTRDELDSLVIDTDADLARLWQLLVPLLAPLPRSLWVSLVGGDRRPIPWLLEVAELPPSVDGRRGEETVDGLFSLLHDLLREEGGGATVALLLTRPSAGPMTTGDRALARALVAGSRRSGVPLERVFVADGYHVVPVAPDDLVA